MIPSRSIFLLLLVLGLLSPTTAFGNSLNVVVSIPPLHAITREIMHGINEPHLLLDSAQSPHHFQLQPSQLRKLTGSDLFFWIGPEMESPLSKAVSLLNKRIEVVTLIEHPGMQLLPLGHSHHHDETHTSDEARARNKSIPTEHGNRDPHLWLHLGNVRILAKAIAAKLAAHDPVNKAIYQQNAEQLLASLDELQKQLQNRLDPARASRILALHDAWRYFTTTFGLQNYHAIESDGLEHLGTASYLLLQQQIKSDAFDCVVAGPETSVKKARQLTENTRATLLLLDPLGYRELANDSFANWYESLANQFAACQKQQGPA
jgi:zinc transport system substrate-binding protein